MVNNNYFHKTGCVLCSPSVIDYTPHLQGLLTASVALCCLTGAAKDLQAKAKSEEQEPGMTQPQQQGWEPVPAGMNKHRRITHNINSLERSRELREEQEKESQH